jgi:hypothetical protein
MNLEVITNFMPGLVWPIHLDADALRFLAVCAELLGTIQDRGTAILIAGDLASGDSAKWEVLTCAFVRVVLQHIYQGFPLLFCPAMIAAYMAAGVNIQTPLFECAECGLGLPRSFKTCPCCGGLVGLGVHAAKMGWRAGLN